MAFDIYQHVTDKIIEQLEQGQIPWHKPWKVAGLKIKGGNSLRSVAFNRVTKTAYSALNQMLLSRQGEYASFKQWKDIGGSIKKGAKAEIVVFWKMLDVKDEEKDEVKKIPFLRYMQVFHITDVDGVEPLKAIDIKPEEEFAPNEEAEKVINNYLSRENIKLSYYGDSAFYSPLTDSIQLPQRSQFGKKSSEFYSTIFHEITHSTGAKHRLDRLSKTAFFGNSEYSKEELVAEIGAACMLNVLNIETDKTFKNSVAYIQSWIKVLKNDKRLIVSASSKAEKAVNFIFNENEQGAV